MKKIIIGAILISIDQLIKLWIFKFLMGINVVLIPQVLRFHPVQNINLNWIASIVDYKTTVIQMVILQLVFVIIVLLFYRYMAYCSYSNQLERLLMKLFVLSFIVGICCSFIDVVFWGGSLDFVRLFDWDTFDTKDVYLTASQIFLFFYLIKYIKRYYGLNSKQRKLLKNQQSIKEWIKAGLPISQK